MKVAEVMEKDVDYVLVDTPVEEVARLIFGHGINGVPVCKDKKVIGFITERDILSRFYPSLKEYIEDRVHASDFEAMENKVFEILSLPAQEIMSNNPVLITPETPLLRALSLMFIQKVGRLPVVDEKGDLVGILSKGDIFRNLVGKKIPYSQDEEFHDWLSKYYDMFIDWKVRLGFEITDLVSLFRREKIKRVLDIGCGTGEHALSLVKNGFETVGIEKSTLMAQKAKGKWEKLPPNLKKKLEFVKGDYFEYLKDKKGKFGAAIIMGNALAHNPFDWQKILKVAKETLLKNSLIVIQLLNFMKVLKINKGFNDFNINQNQEGKYAFLKFYAPSETKSQYLTLTMAVLHFDGKRWGLKTINSAPVANISQNKIKSVLTRLKFKQIAFYGGRLWGPLFSQPFNPQTSDWLNVVAKC